MLGAPPPLSSDHRNQNRDLVVADGPGSSLTCAVVELRGAGGGPHAGVVAVRTRCQPLAPKASARCVKRCKHACDQRVSVRVDPVDVIHVGVRCYTAATCPAGSLDQHASYRLTAWLHVEEPRGDGLAGVVLGYGGRSVVVRPVGRLRPRTGTTNLSVYADRQDPAV